MTSATIGKTKATEKEIEKALIINKYLPENKKRKVLIFDIPENNKK